MPKLIIPEDKVISVQDGQSSISAESKAAASSANIGQITSNEGTNAVISRAKLGEIQSSQAAGSLADAGQELGQQIGKNEASAAASYAQIGQTAFEAGQSVQQAGTAMLNKAMDEMGNYMKASRGAVDDGVYNNTAADAMQEFNDMVNERLGNTQDENGNPTFASLPDDVDGIAQGISTKYSHKLGKNAMAKYKFNEEFGAYANNKKLRVMKEARGQQIDFSKKALEKYLNTNTSAALSSGDRASLPEYVASAYDKIDNGYKNGYISHDQAVNLKDKSRKNINYGYLKNLAQKDPNLMYDELGMGDPKNAKDNTFLGINFVERAKLTDITAKRIAEQRRADKARALEEKALLTEQQIFHADNLELGIAKGSIGEADIDSVFNEGKISHHQMTTLKLKVINEDNKRIKTGEVRQNISNDISTDSLLPGKYSNAAINNHFSTQVDSTGASDLFNAEAPMDRTRLAAQYKTPVTQYTNELEGIAKGGTPEQIMSGLNSYRYVSQKSPLAVSKMDSKTQAFYSVIDSQTKYANIDPAHAIENAKTLTFDATDEQYKSRMNTWDNKDSPLNSANINNTITGMYDLGHGFFTDDKVSNFAKQEITKQLKDAYILTGDFEAAKSMVSSQTKGVFGTSEVNNISQWTRDNSVFMFAPPESVYGPGTPSNYTPEEMRANLNKDVAPLLTSSDLVNQSNIKPEQVMVGSGDFTSRAPGKATYSLYYIDNAGIEQPIVNPQTGQPVFWKPDATEISDYRMQKGQEGLNQAMDQQQRFSQITGLPNPMKNDTTVNESKTESLGMKQYNPGNIKKNGMRWDGEVPNTTSHLKEFASPEDGIGAIVNNLKTNYLSRGMNTLDKLVPDGKDKDSYTKDLSDAIGLKPNQKIDLDKLHPRQYVELIKAIIRKENGYNPYPDHMIMDGILRGQ